ncbi:MAG: DUF6265 family protein [Myxococcota bacterium]
MLTLAFAILTSTTPLPDMTWMAGYWLNCDGGRETSETWSDQHRDVVVGTSLAVSPQELWWEHMRISVAEGRATFFAMPSDQKATEFKSIELGERRVVFENREHDFPQRVIYSRKGEQLIGRIEGSENGTAKAIEWRYKKAALNSHCPRK